MADVKEQRIYITSCLKLCKTTAETHKMVKEVFGDNSVGLTQTYEWFKHFKKERKSVDDDERSGRPSTGTTTENMAEMREAVLEDRMRTIHDVCDIVKLSYGTCQQILLQELNMRRIAVKFVPRLPSNDQKERRVTVCSELKEQTENDPNFISTIITRP
jgi:hypothetical protein